MAENHWSNNIIFQVRLQNDRRNSGDEWTPGEIGRLEVLHKGVWGTVCDNGFGQAEADVACRMMGYDISSGDHASLYDGVVDYTAKGGPIWINFGHTGPCQGNEDDLRDCQASLDSKLLPVPPFELPEKNT